MRVSFENERMMALVKRCNKYFRKITALIRRPPKQEALIDEPYRTCEQCLEIHQVYQGSFAYDPDSDSTDTYSNRLNRARHASDIVLTWEYDPGTPNGCKFCQLLLAAYEASGGKDFAEPKPRIYFIDINSELPGPHRWGITVLTGDTRPPPRRRPMGYCTPHFSKEERWRHGLIYPAVSSKAAHQEGFVGCLLDPSLVQYSTLRRWTDRCISEHPKCSAAQHHSPQDISVIDCSTKRIVKHQPQMSYCALSYVWGTSGQTGGSIGVEEDWPRTVQDAIHVVRSLDYRYLWVDRYCIPRDDPEVTRMQISMMDRIYEAAEVTIVAAAGEDCHYGLCGAGTVPFVPRQQQQQASIDGMTYVFAKGDISKIQQTVWATRAWTYQEAMLSKRCLIFTTEQVLFLCKTDYFTEMMPETPQVFETQDNLLTLENIFQSLASQENFSDSRPGLGSRSALEVLQNHIHTYGHRSLTYESDALNGIRGFLERSGFWSYYGIPCIPGSGRPHPRKDVLLTEYGSLQTQNFTLGILCGLAWYVGGDSRSGKSRNGEFPSWSWINLRDRSIVFSMDGDQQTGLIQRKNSSVGSITDLASIMVENSNEVGTDKQWIPLSSIWQNSTSVNHAIPEVSTLLKIDSLAIDIETFSLAIETIDNKEEIICTISYGTGKTESFPYMDDTSSLLSQYGVGTHSDLPGWKLVLIYTNIEWRDDAPDFIFNCDHLRRGGRHYMQGNLLHSYGLVVVPTAELRWRRIGAVIRCPQLFFQRHNMERQSLVLE